MKQLQKPNRSKEIRVSKPNKFRDEGQANHIANSLKTRVNPPYLGFSPSIEYRDERQKNQANISTKKIKSETLKRARTFNIKKHSRRTT